MPFSADWLITQGGKVSEALQGPACAYRATPRRAVVAVPPGWRLNQSKLRQARVFGFLDVLFIP